LLAVASADSDPKDTNNYRGITLLSVVGMLTNKVIANRLIGAVEEHELLHEAQNAFRPGRSTDDHIFTLSQLVRGRKNRNQRTYAFFLDLQKAYDTGCGGMACCMCCGRRASEASCGTTSGIWGAEAEVVAGALGVQQD
jgi:hypothetical protein